MYKLFFVALLTISSASATVVSTGVHFYVNGFDVSSMLGLPSSIIGLTNFTMPSAVTVGGSSKILLHFGAMPDPDVNYFLGVQNTSSTIQAYSFPLVIGYVGGPYTTLTDSFSDSFTDAGFDGAVTVGIPAGSTSIAQPQVDGVNQDGQGMGCMPTGGIGFSGSCDPGPNLTTITIPTTGASGTFGVVVSFTLSPGDIYTLNGDVMLSGTPITTSTPEPSTFVFASGAFGLLLLASTLRVNAKLK